jgi:hypothetical protein
MRPLKLGIGEIPCIFPDSREFAMETGSHMTAHTTIQVIEQTRFSRSHLKL